jgi:hypothetical protein
MYALAFTDGTYLNVWDNETGTIDDNVWSKFTSRTDKKVCGVVYYNGGIVGEDIRDNVLQYYHPSCTHGYIVALNDLTTERTAWQNPYVFVYDVFQNTEGNAMNPTTSSNPKYEPIFIEYVYPDGGNNTQLAKALGYNNTKVLKAFNDDYCVGDNVDYKVKAVEYLEDFAKSIDAPEGSSGWYIPSPKELELIGSNDIDFFGGGCDYYATERFKAVKSVLEKLGEDGLGTAVLNEGVYWSSSECRFTHSPSGNVRLDVWTMGYSQNQYVKFGLVNHIDKDYNYYLRAVCAF